MDRVSKSFCICFYTGCPKVLQLCENGKDDKDFYNGQGVQKFYNFVKMVKMVKMVFLVKMVQWTGCPKAFMQGIVLEPILCL